MLGSSSSSCSSAWKRAAGAEDSDRHAVSSKKKRGSAVGQPRGSAVGARAGWCSRARGLGRGRGCLRRRAGQSPAAWRAACSSRPHRWQARPLHSPGPSACAPEPRTLRARKLLAPEVQLHLGQPRVEQLAGQRAEEGVGHVLGPARRGGGQGGACQSHARCPAGQLAAREPPSAPLARAPASTASIHGQPTHLTMNGSYFSSPCSSSAAALSLAYFLPLQAGKRRAREGRRGAMMQREGAGQSRAQAAAAGARQPPPPDAAVCARHLAPLLCACPGMPVYACMSGLPGCTAAAAMRGGAPPLT